MPTPRFITGRSHQGATISWAARRSYGKRAIFKSRGEAPLPQHGVLLADGVGMGKTREALGAAALILLLRYGGRKTLGGMDRERHQKAESRVLVLCPPGLVGKWADEIRGEGDHTFHDALEKWTHCDFHRREFVEKTLARAWCIRHRNDLPENVPNGTYICNWNVARKSVGSGNSRLARFLKNDWKVVIVDEAHHSEAREAVTRIDYRKPINNLLLLSATPFQLDPKEIRRPLAFLIGKPHRGRRDDELRDPLRRRGPVWEFAEAMGGFFAGKSAPSRRQKLEAERELSQLVARSRPITSGRKYQVIQGDGQSQSIHDPAGQTEEELAKTLACGIDLPPAFQAHYLMERMRLAQLPTTTKKIHVPQKLLALLTKPDQHNQEREHPRLASLARWVQRQTTEDLGHLGEDGVPRKILVFTSLVGDVHEAIKRTVDQAFTKAWHDVRDTRTWRSVLEKAPHGIEKLSQLLTQDWSTNRRGRQAHALPQGLGESLDSLRRSPEQSPFAAALGIPRYRRLVRQCVRGLLEELGSETGDSDIAWERQRHADSRRKLQAISESWRDKSVTARFSGHLSRSERDRSGYAFCSPVGPWILIASRAGSEGIDLHTFSTHLVHYDLEWNPAVMEQREGRCDRIGRHALLRKEPVTVSYLLLKGTYDERMFRQVVARQRWQPLLLGQQAKALSTSDDASLHARTIEVRTAESWMLNLVPRW